MARRAGWVLVTALTILGQATGSAGASFPGRNGKIVYASTDGSAYRGGPNATSIRAVDPRSGRFRVLRDCPLIAGGVTNCTLWGPRYSPDGNRIALPTTRILPDPFQPWQWWSGFGTMAADGSGFEEHAPGYAYLTLAWSPAGDRLLLQRALVLQDSSRPPDYSKPSAIFLASLDGTEQSQVTSVGTEPDWSSRGEIAFTRPRPTPSCPGCSDIYVTRLGGTPRRLTHRPARSPSWSPHGTKLAFVRENHTRPNRVTADVYIVGRDGHGLRRLTRRGGYSPAWSPDGKRIAFLRGAHDLYVVRTNGRGLRRVLNAGTRAPYDPQGGSVTSLDWQTLPRDR